MPQRLFPYGKLGRTTSGFFALAILAGCAGEPKAPRSAEPTRDAGVDGFLEDGGHESVSGDAGSAPQGQDASQQWFEAGSSCASVSAEAQLEPVHLAFAFDVSGSMGKGDKPWHDMELKWAPVVQATLGFFEADVSRGLLASLTFFPEEGDEDERCVMEAYAEPDVPMRALPSTDFAEAIADITPVSDDDWRGGTPTAFVVGGLRRSLAAYREDHAGRFALVLVTDGYPQGCDERDSLEAVVAEVEAARDTGFTTYVIGVANPPVDDAPDTTSDLGMLAAAGGSEEAFLIDTGDPEATAERLAMAVDAIRSSAIACDLPIPEPPDGTRFDREHVAVQYSTGQASLRTLTYDPECAQTEGWHYDDPDAPQRILLCPEVCEAVQASAQGTVEVQFTCEQTVEVL